MEKSNTLDALDVINSIEIVDWDSQGQEMLYAFAIHNDENVSKLKLIGYDDEAIAKVSFSENGECATTGNERYIDMAMIGFDHATMLNLVDMKFYNL